MAKRKRKGTKRRKSRGKKSKGTKSSKHSLLLEGAGVWDGYKVLTTDGLGGAIIKAPFDKPTRDSMANYIKRGSLKSNIMANTKELQLVAIFKVAQKLPLIKGPANAAARALNSLGRQMGLKGKYKVI